MLDPFAGGSARGIVAAKCGREYVGVDLRAEQVDENRRQVSAILDERDPAPVWVCGNSDNIDVLAPGEYDLVFSCPPYFDLEQYSDEAGDLSTIGSYDDFLKSYRAIISASVAMLKPDRFACFVVGDIRDKKGHYRKFPWHTVEAFADAGLELYNEAVLVTAVGSLPLRVGKQFEIGRKLGKTHQNVLVFVKGDWRRATEAVGPVDFGKGEE